MVKKENVRSSYTVTSAGTIVPAFSLVASLYRLTKSPIVRRLTP